MSRVLRAPVLPPPPPFYAACCFLTLCVHSRAEPAIHDCPKLRSHKGGHRDTASTSLLFLRGAKPLSTSRRGPSLSTCCSGPTRGSLWPGGPELFHLMLTALHQLRSTQQTAWLLLSQGLLSEQSQDLRWEGRLGHHQDMVAVVNKPREQVTVYTKDSTCRLESWLVRGRPGLRVDDSNPGHCGPSLGSENDAGART